MRIRRLPREKTFGRGRIRQVGLGDVDRLKKDLSCAYEDIRALDRTPTEELAVDTSIGGGVVHDLWAVTLEASRLDEVVELVVRTLEFSVLAKYVFGLAQRFNAFYHRYPILNEENTARKYWRAAGVAYFRAQLTRAVDLMGIEVPLRM